MNETTPGIGHNIGKSAISLHDELVERFRAQIEQRDSTVAEATFLPDAVVDDETLARTGEFIRGLTSTLKQFEALRVETKKPVLLMGSAIDTFFASLAEPVETLKTKLGKRNTDYQVAKANAERAERERIAAEAKARAEEAERQRKEAEREAAEAKRKAEEAERKRKEQADADAEATKRASREAEEAKRQAEAKLKAATNAESVAARDASKAQTAATAISADMARVRGRGTTVTLTQAWELIDLQRGEIDLEALRGFIKIEHLQQAARAWLQANNATVQNGEELKGARFVRAHQSVSR